MQGIDKCNKNFKKSPDFIFL